MSRKLPETASIATPHGEAKLHAPSAERNAKALCEMLQSHAPHTGNALEIASGTGQHVVAFANALPGLNWQPTEIDSARRASIDAYVAEAGLPNIALAKRLDAAAQGWGQIQGCQDLIILINLLHLIARPEVTTLVAEASIALTLGGTLILYGPFKRSGVLTSEGDARFDADLKTADPEIGYKDDLDILCMLDDAGLTLTDTVQMPANNLAFIARKALP